MLNRQTLGRLATLRRTLTTGQVESQQLDEEYLSAKTYQTIPKISTLKILWSMMDSKEKTILDKVFQAHHNTVGSIFKICIPGQSDRVCINQPELLRTLMSKEGKMPVEPAFDPMVHYRNVIRKDLFSETAGLVGAHGDPWYEVRSKVQQDMMRPKSAMFYIRDIEEISQQFVDLITANADSNGEVEDIVRHIQCWSLESTAAIFLDTKLGVLDPNLPEDSEGRKFIRAVNVFLGPDLNEISMGPPIWKYVATPAYKRWDKSQLTIFRITKKYVDAALEKYQEEGKKDDSELSVLERMIARCGVGSQIPLVMAQDALTAGVDTTGSTVAFFLLDLANNPSQQEELYQEIKRVVGEGNITESKLKQMKYLKACLHESQRLNPAVLGISRTVPTDIVLGGYQIPRGTIVTCITRNIMLDPDNFPDPLQFRPERWLRGCPHHHKAHPFAYLPFGHGPRKCIGMRFAELETFIIAIKILQSYKLEYLHQPVGIQTDFVNKPDKKIKMKLIPRN